MRQGDREAMQDIMDDMIAFSVKNPAMAITPKSIKRSIDQHMKTSKSMVHGVTLNPRLRLDLLENMSEYDSDISIWE